MDLFTMPRLWNRLVPTIWNPMMGKAQFMMRMPRVAISFKAGSLVKALTVSPGKNSQTIKPNTKISVAHAAVIRYTLRTRLYCRAP